MSQSPQPLRRRRNVAKLLAKLNTKIMPIEPTFGGGPPAETAIDVAAALGLAGQMGAPQRLAVMVLCLRWWPGVFDGPPRTIGYRTVKRSYEAGRDREDPAKPGRHFYVERMPVEAPGETPAYLTAVSLVRSSLLRAIERDRARAAKGGPARMFARPLPDVLYRRMTGAPRFLPDWGRLVIEEYRKPNQCQSCHGYGERLRLVGEGKDVRSKVEPCPVCLGQGVLPWAVRRRAKGLRISEHPWRQYLNPYHEGGLALLRELEWRGARMLVRKLGFPDER